MTSASVKLLRTQSDERLVALAAAGHERAFEAIVERYRRPLLRHCRRYLPAARAEDALQQSLVSAWTGLRRGDEVRELSPWLHRIVHNTSLNALRVAGYDYEQLRETLQGEGGPADLAERRAVIRQTLAALASLPERQRAALLQIAVEGRSQEEVAEELGLSNNAVRQLVHRARSRVREAATAVTPLPLASWLAGGGGDARGDLVARIAEAVAGAGGGATLAKAGAVATLAGGAISAPVVVDEIAERPGARDRQAAITAPARQERQRPAEGVSQYAPEAPVVIADAPQQPQDAFGSRGPVSSRRDGGEDRSGRRDGGARRSGQVGDDDRSSPGLGGAQVDSSLPVSSGGGGAAVGAEGNARPAPAGGEAVGDGAGAYDRGGGGGAEEGDDGGDAGAVPVSQDAPENDDEPESQQPAGSGASSSDSAGNDSSDKGSSDKGSSDKGSSDKGSSGNGSSDKGLSGNGSAASASPAPGSSATDSSAAGSSAPGSPTRSSPAPTSQAPASPAPSSTAPAAPAPAAPAPAPASPAPDSGSSGAGAGTTVPPDPGAAVSASGA